MLTQDDFDSDCLTLENDGKFYAEYGKNSTSHRDKRTTIVRFLRAARTDSYKRGVGTQDFPPYLQALVWYFDTRYGFINQTTQDEIPGTSHWPRPGYFNPAPEQAPSVTQEMVRTPGPAQAKFDQLARALLANSGFIKSYAKEAYRITRGKARQMISEFCYTYSRLGSADMEMKEDLRCYLNKRLDVENLVGSPAITLPDGYLPRHTWVTGDDRATPTTDPAPTPLPPEIAKVQETDRTNRPQPTPKEPEMNPIAITTLTLLNGVDIAKSTDDALYALIAEQEAEIEKLLKIKNKPKRLKAKIEQHQAGITALVAYLDSRDVKE